jgi:spore germination protein KA
MDTNLYLIRKLIVNKSLIVKKFLVGSETNTRIAMLYMESYSNSYILVEVQRRIQGITIDSILSSGQLVQLIEDHPFSPFPQKLTTERADRLLRI